MVKELEEWEKATEQENNLKFAKKDVDQLRAKWGSGNDGKGIWSQRLCI